MLRRILIAAALLGLSPGAALAQTPPPPGSGPGGEHQPRPDPFGDATVTRAQASRKITIAAMMTIRQIKAG